MQKRKLAMMGLILFTSGCSLLMPYEEDFSCRLKDNYGKCVSVSGAYEEAVTGQEKAPHLVAGETIESLESEHDDDNSKVQAKASKERNNDYGMYRQEMYKELTGLIADPATPMLKPPKTIRTLILPYSARNEKTRLYMPRYVYSIVEDPRWVMGQYLYNKNEFDHDFVGGGE